MPKVFSGAIKGEDHYLTLITNPEKGKTFRERDT